MGDDANIVFITTPGQVCTFFNSFYNQRSVYEYSQCFLRSFIYVENHISISSPNTLGTMKSPGNKPFLTCLQR